MKKILSFAMAIALMLPNILTFHAHAAEVDFTDYNQHIALAKEVFPEYANKLEGNNTTSRSVPYSRSSEASIAVRETRAADANTIITYTEYDNGIVTLGTARFSKTADIEIEDYETYSNYKLYTATIVASVIEGPTFTATDVQYRIYPATYDQIINIGTPGIPGYTSDDFEIYSRSEETASKSAFVSYTFDCPVGMSHYSGSVIFTLANNQTSVEFDIW